MRTHKVALAQAQYVGIQLGALILLALGLSLDRSGTRSVFETLLSWLIVFGLPCSIAVAAARRRYTALFAVLSLAVVAGLLVLLAARQFEELRESILVEARVRWWIFVGLTVVSVVFATFVIFRHGQRRILAAFVGAVLGGLLVLGTAGRLPGFTASVQEDGWVEWATVYAFCGAFVCAVLAIRRRFCAGGREWPFLVGLACLAAFCLFCAGEELSWGQRLLGFEPPEVFMQQNFQQETNVHNFLRGKNWHGVPLDTRYLVIYVCLLYGLVAPLARGIAGRLVDREWAASTLLAPSWYLAPGFAAVALGEFNYPVNHAGEACEMLLGLTLCMDGLLRARSMQAARPAFAWNFRPAMVTVAIIALAAITAPVVDRLVYGAATETAALTRSEIEWLRADLLASGTVQRSLLRKNVHKRLFSAVGAGYLVFGEDSRFLEWREDSTPETQDWPRRDRVGYFLDPWNNSYWIKHRKRYDTIIVYSFGPNRHRDTLFDDFTAEQWRTADLAGDDIGFAISTDALERNYLGPESP